MTPLGQAAAPPRARAYFWLALLLLTAGGVQSAFAASLSAFGGQPDFLLALTLSAALLAEPRVGAVVGMAGGLVTAATAGQAVGTLLVSRTFGGFAASSLALRLYRGNVVVIFMGVFAITVLTEVVYGLAAPRGTLRMWAQSVAVSAVMNALLALPFTVVLRRCGWGRNRL